MTGHLRDPACRPLRQRPQPCSPDDLPHRRGQLSGRRPRARPRVARRAARRRFPRDRRLVRAGPPTVPPVPACTASCRRCPRTPGVNAYLLEDDDGIVSDRRRWALPSPGGCSRRPWPMLTTPRPSPDPGTHIHRDTTARRVRSPQVPAAGRVRVARRRRAPRRCCCGSGTRSPVTSLRSLCRSNDLPRRADPRKCSTAPTSTTGTGSRPMSGARRGRAPGSPARAAGGAHAGAHPGAVVHGTRRTAVAPPMNVRR